MTIFPFHIIVSNPTSGLGFFYLLLVFHLCFWPVLPSQSLLTDPPSISIPESCSPSWIPILAIFSLNTIFLGHSIRSIYLRSTCYMQGTVQGAHRTSGFNHLPQPKNTQISLYPEWLGCTPTLHMISPPQWAWYISISACQFPPHFCISPSFRHIPSSCYRHYHALSCLRLNPGHQHLFTSIPFLAVNH